MQEQPLSWLDTKQEETKEHILTSYGKDICLLENQIDLISASVFELGEPLKGTGLKVGEFKRQADEKLLCRYVPVFLLFYALDNLQAARLNLLNGYLSVTHVCLRNVVEALRLADMAASSADFARGWLDNQKSKKPPDFKFHPTILAVMKVYDNLCKGGAHPTSIARFYSAVGKVGAVGLVQNIDGPTEIQSVIRLATQISANLLGFMYDRFSDVLGREQYLVNRLQLIFDEMRKAATT